ncbi:hypothetical protein [Falsiroseomonas algicola]|uniref:hypothetical protein n=1 Tax=Falsiroseomonas algicola TaxID=2716930 RepID=UPI001F21E8E7|nr:hypothetical protein [Falsiroseomonas algicola]
MTHGGDRVHDASDPPDHRLLLGAKPPTLGVLPPQPFLCLGAIGRDEGLHHIDGQEALAKRGEDPILEIMLPH